MPLSSPRIREYPGRSESLRPWQPKKLLVVRFRPAAENGRPGWINSSVYDEPLGRTYSETALRRAMHKCQGMAHCRASGRCPGNARRVHVEKDRDGAATDGVDTSSARSHSMPDRVRRRIVDGHGIASQVRTAQQRFDAETTTAVAPLLAGLHVARVLRAQLRGMAMDGGKVRHRVPAAAKRREFQQAIIIANGLHRRAVERRRGGARTGREVVAYRRQQRRGGSGDSSGEVQRLHG